MNQFCPAAHLKRLAGGGVAGGVAHSDAQLRQRRLGAHLQRARPLNRQLSWRPRPQLHSESILGQQGGAALTGAVPHRDLERAAGRQGQPWGVSGKL